jgi:hypothetical protein
MAIFELFSSTRSATKGTTSNAEMEPNGREFVRRQFEAEFRPILLTYATGRSAESIPFLCTQHDLTRMATAGRRMMEICNARHEDRIGERLSVRTTSGVLGYALCQHGFWLFGQVQFGLAHGLFE